MKWRLYKEKLYWLRIQNGWSQEEAGTYCGGVERKHYFLWESGKTPRPHKSTLEAITKGFSLKSIEEIQLKPNETPDPDYLYSYTNRHKNQLENPSTLQKTNSKYKAVIFDLDGTLLKGFDFSWAAVWKYIGDDGGNRKRYTKLYHSKKISYSQWCAYCLESYIKAKLSRSDFQKITSEFRATDQLYETLDSLKSQGYILGIISGGINTFLEELIPDWDDYFDYVFTNQLTFDNKGLLIDIVPTPYDFEGKSQGIKFICDKAGIDISSVIFVGESFNDKYVIDTAGLTIAYTPISKELEELFDVVIEKEGLKQILKYLKTN